MTKKTVNHGWFDVDIWLVAITMRVVKLSLATSLEEKSSRSISQIWSDFTGNMNRKPQPLYLPSIRKYCPVCGQASYSAAGIHPQCAVQQMDAKRMKQVKVPSKSPKKASSLTDAETRPWHKICPKCREFVHVRKKACDCGYAFSRTRST